MYATMPAITDIYCQYTKKDHPEAQIQDGRILWDVITQKMHRFIVSHPFIKCTYFLERMWFFYEITKRIWERLQIIRAQEESLVREEDSRVEG
jgi:hypothetical protein